MLSEEQSMATLTLDLLQATDPITSSLTWVCSSMPHGFSTCLDTLPPECLLPGLHWRYLFQLRFCRDIDEDRLITGQRLGNDRTELIRIGNAHTAYPKGLCDGNGIPCIGEIDTQIPFVIERTLKHLKS